MQYQKNISPLVILVSLALLAAGCGNDGTTTRQNTGSSDDGTLRISADESFKPIIDSQIQVYESQHPETHIIADYKSEAECLKDIATDSTRMIIVPALPVKMKASILKKRISLSSVTVYWRTMQ